MSFALPSVKSKPEMPVEFGITDGPFGAPNLTYSVKSDLETAHPLQQTEINYKKNKDVLNMTVLRNTQGLHAPLRIAMEMKAAQKVGRLPFLPSSNVMLESLSGRDIEMDPTDIFGIPEFQEIAALPHATVEKSLGIN